MIETEVSVKNGRVILEIEGQAGDVPSADDGPFWLSLNPADAADLAHRLLHAATEAEHGS